MEVGTDCKLVYQLWKDRHEIALHTVHHPPLVPTFPNMTEEIMGVRIWLNQTCGIPLEEMRGFRAPYLVHNPEVRSVIYRNGLLYDSSIEEPVGPFTPSGNFSHRGWPYTMDDGIAQLCNWTYPAAMCLPTERYPGLWEIPLWDLPSAYTNINQNSYTMNPGNGYGGDLYTTLSTDFDMSYNGNRAPFPIYVHTPWFNANTSSSLQKFIDYALSKPDVYFVTMQELIAWMENPVSAADFNSSYTACNYVASPVLPRPPLPPLPPLLLPCPPRGPPIRLHRSSPKRARLMWCRWVKASTSLLPNYQSIQP